MGGESRSQMKERSLSDDFLSLDESRRLQSGKS